MGEKIKKIQQELFFSERGPMLFGMFIVYIATIIFQMDSEFNKDEFSGLTIVLTIQGLLFMFEKKIFRNQTWLYFIVQGIIISNYAVIMKDGFEPILFGMYPMFIAQSIARYRDGRVVFGFSIFYYTLFIITTIFYGNGDKLLEYLPMFTITIIAIIVFYKLFTNQVTLRIRYQHLTKELELANRKVEELTAVSERQKIARDLHDTLSQGLVGLVMQLDAIDANLAGGKVERAGEITRQAAGHARLTLAESRNVIAGLREEKPPAYSFQQTMLEEIRHAEALLKFKVIKNIQMDVPIRTQDANQCVYLLRECLNNVIKHAKASLVRVTVVEADGFVYMEVQDNGVGFDKQKVKKFDRHFGLIGIEERVKALEGQLIIESEKKQGTKIKLQFPIREDEAYE